MGQAVVWYTGQFGDIYYGLWYPIVVAGATLIIGLFFLPETFKRGIA